MMDTAATRWTAATVCYVTDDLRKHYAGTHRGMPVSVISNGVERIDKERMERPATFSHNWFNLAIVGRIDKVKGHDVAIQALATRETPLDAHLHIIGTGPREAELRELAEMYGVRDRVHFLGFQRNIYQYLAHSDVILMPSLHEGLPYTLLESMALGTPLITSQVGGLAEILNNNVTGLLIPPGDYQALAKAISSLRNDPQLRQLLGENAQQVQRARYSVKSMTELYCKAYQNSLRRLSSQV